MELTSVVKFFSFYLARQTPDENFNINATDISNDMCKVWWTLKRGEWRYRPRPSVLFAFFEKSSLGIRIKSYYIKLINKAFARYRTPPKWKVLLCSIPGFSHFNRCGNVMIVVVSYINAGSDTHDTMQKGGSSTVTSEFWRREDSSSTTSSTFRRGFR